MVVRDCFVSIVRTVERTNGHRIDRSQALFRPAAVAASRTDALGPIVLARPVALSALTGVALLIVVLVAGFFGFGTYTAHSTLRGRLIPDRGVIDVRSPQLGTILERRVGEGQLVESGDVLFIVSSERNTAALGPTQRVVAEQLEDRRRSLAAQIENTRVLQRLERRSLDESATALRSEAVTLEQTLADQRERVRLAEETAQRYERVRAQGYVAEELLLAKRVDLLEQRGRLQGLERERSGIGRQLTDVASRSDSLELRYRNQIADLERSVTAAELDIAENEARREIVVTAPADGTATGIAAVVGQAVDGSTPLAFIVPNDARLRAELYAPSRAVGFVAVGEEVLLRYEPYPYQKFGHYRGVVETVSRTAVPPSARTESPPGGGPVYEVIVALESQTVTAYGERRELRAGMAVEADVLLETRRLYEWILEPLYSLRGQFR
jgi:membrane fusion protein